MNDRTDETTFTKEYLLKKAKNLATQIDFETLIQEGVLEKKGAWYKVLNMKRLPEHAKAQITEVSSEGKVKFSKTTKSASRLVQKLSK